MVTTYLYDGTNLFFTEQVPSETANHSYGAAVNRARKVIQGGVVSADAGDSMNRMTQAEAACTLNFRYNGDNRRVTREEESGATLNFVYDFEKMIHSADAADDASTGYTYALADEFGDLVSQDQRDGGSHDSGCD